MRRPPRSTLVALATASLLALLEIFRTSVTRTIAGDVLTTRVPLHHVLPTWITVVLVSPWCAFMARRFPFRSGRTVRTLFAHLGGAAVFVALHMTLLILFHLARGVHRAFPSAPLMVHTVHTYFFTIAMEMSVYAAIVLVLLLLDARREAAAREVAAARLERNVAAARLESLQAQIRPHFLFNTLNALAVLARRGDGAAVDRAIGDLGELLRASFAAPGGHEIPLAEELAFVERYVALQRLRFADRLEVEWDIEEAARGARVPALLLQPLVENAIEHGLATTRGGRVRVSARRAGEDLEIEVADDGAGFAARAAGDAMGAGATDDARGVGLANTRERLALLHGGRSTLECGDAPGGGGRVRVRLPWRTTLAPAAGGA
ncbi:MAG: hypothetical protein E6K81_04325 [Candidatus Eisenbacteria bacterium]|uniref:histidine kinase n=1 Tax=Eiseniibacteriota bacterium TaxID=2212470 RepID=A0A538UCR4_UNCEI|nr:MAG: hypothetical protein E6K81_04325 [Candidatus Eisenbacteria bacterium]